MVLVRLEDRESVKIMKGKHKMKGGGMCRWMMTLRGRKEG